VDALDDSLVQRAFSRGKTLDLSGCVYGPTHWQGRAMSTETPPYYALLAGLVRETGAATVVELGTHSGGATLAMVRGFADEAASRIVTVDVTAIDNAPLQASPAVRRVQGDVFAASTIAQVTRALEGRPVDLLFVDIVHGYHQTRRALGLYANRLQPALIALDDVNLNGGMRILWAELRSAYASVDASALVAREGPGFGLVQPGRPLRLPEGEAWRSVLWDVRRAVSARTPYPVKRRVLRVLDALPSSVRKRIDPS
jgi:predicted O-methyltransferase YrrM